MEKWCKGRIDHFAPLYDVEEFDEWYMPVRIHAIAVGAETAQRIIDGLKLP
jgi:hypothetical protein